MKFAVFIIRHFTITQKLTILLLYLFDCEWYDYIVCSTYSLLFPSYFVDIKIDLEIIQGPRIKSFFLFSGAANDKFCIK